MEKINQDRAQEIYDRLVDETDNPLTLHDRKKNDLLGILLDVMEYIQEGSEDENPLDDIFGG